MLLKRVTGNVMWCYWLEEEANGMNAWKVMNISWMLMMKTN
jgi:hypothetical protein